jgi:phosphoglycolate phosphatase-like HAD superfamily hydrolase
VSNSKQNPLVIWDFDGVLCDSLIECATVTCVAAFQLDNPKIEVTKKNLHQICKPEIISTYYERLSPLRPFIVKGQDYLWQHYHLATSPNLFDSFSGYKQELEFVHSIELDKIYEAAFYQARKLVANIMGPQYRQLFKPYLSALYAFRSSMQLYKTYICTARDQNGVQSLLGNNSIEFPRQDIFSKDFNGIAKNPGLSKSQQILGVLESAGGASQNFTIVEDQIKAPCELIERCKNMKVVCASYGYGLKTDWDNAGLQNLVRVKSPAELIYEIY